MDKKNVHEMKGKRKSRQKEKIEIQRKMEKNGAEIKKE